MADFDRITQWPEVMGGKPCIQRMRVTVCMIGSGHAIEAILADYPYLEREDLLQVLRFAAWRADDHEILLVARAKQSHDTPPDPVEPPNQSNARQKKI